MRMPDPSRSRPSPWMVRPSGLIWVLIRTTAETRSSIEAVSAAAAEALTSEMRIAPSTARDAMPAELPRKALAMNTPSAPDRMLVRWTGSIDFELREIGARRKLSAQEHTYESDNRAHNLAAAKNT